jgi:spore coat protein A, manganese oxidase
MTTEPPSDAQSPPPPARPFWQIGAEGGFLAEPVALDQLLMAPAERADVIVDFTNVPEGTELFLINQGPDEPFGGGVPGADFAPADAETTGQVMKFVVVAPTSPDTSIPPDDLDLPSRPALGEPTNVRQLSLNEADSNTVCYETPTTGIPCEEGLEHVGPRMALLGTVNGQEMPIPMMWGDPLSENIQLGATETWEIYNFTMDAHPIHPHLVDFEVIEREPFEGPSRGPEPWETGPKDTVIAYPGEITRIKARFDREGQYVWHCHILEHEDNEMMRPFVVNME